MPPGPREMTDPGGAHPVPSAADIRLAFATIERTQPEAAEVLRYALEAAEADRFTADLFREAVRQLERSSLAMHRVEPWLERGVTATEADVELRRRAQASAERAEVAERTTALEHVKGVWATLKSASENRALIAAGAGGLGWLVTKVVEGISAWLQP